MYWFNVLVIAPVWGMLSVQLVLQGMIGLINFLVALVASFRRILPIEMMLATLFAPVLMMLIYFGIFVGGKYIVDNFTSLGLTRSGIIVFWVFAVFAVWFMAGQTVNKIKTNWQHCMVPDAMFNDHLDKLAQQARERPIPTDEK
jgi:hypothetical protein